MALPARICSLLPSGTELVAALGEARRLVGRSAECDWPPEVQSLPVVTAARVDTSELDSAAIDAAVRTALAGGRSLYAVDAELIARLEPDLILTQDLCEVCAVSSRDGSLCEIGVETVALDARSLGEIGALAMTLGERLGVPERGRVVAAEIERAVRETTAAVEGFTRRRVFVSEWLEPPFAAGHWLPEMVAAAGGADVLGRAGEPSFPTTWDEVKALAPELVVLAPCGFDLERTLAEAARAAVPALGCPVVAVDANAYFSRPAPRVAAGVRLLAHLLHPEHAPDPGLPLAYVRRRIARRSTISTSS